MALSEFDTIQQAVTCIQAQTSLPFKDALILGSGLGALAEQVTDPVVIPYDTIPHWPTVAVQGHAGNLVIGALDGSPVVVMQGRSHFYEGWSLRQVTFPVRVFAALGVKRLLVTNSSGAINEAFSPGDLMIICDHINLTGVNPLVGPNDDRLGPRFPDMTYTYHPSLQELLETAAAELGIPVHKGVYVGLSGPSYETPAEIRMLRVLGADAAGMSTVPEVIVAAHAGLQVAGLSCTTNMAAGILPKKLNHAEVKQFAQKAERSFIRLIRHYLTKVAQ